MSGHGDDDGRAHQRTFDPPEIVEHLELHRGSASSAAGLRLVTDEVLTVVVDTASDARTRRLAERRPHLVADDSADLRATRRLYVAERADG